MDNELKDICKAGTAVLIMLCIAMLITAIFI